MSSPFPCSPVIREWSWKKTQIEKKIVSFILQEGEKKTEKYPRNKVEVENYVGDPTG